ncbi:MAG: PEGA domain-containing protein [Bdellovibrio sp.]
MLFSQIKRLAILMTCFYAFISTAVAENQNYIIKSAVLPVGLGGERNISLSFSSKLTDGPYSLILKNGSGANLEKQECSGSFIIQLLCRINNAWIDIRISTERVSFAEVDLNGVKIVNSNQFNSGTAALQIPIQLQSSNKLQFKIKGQPISSITYVIRGKTGDVLSGSLVLTSPSDNSSLDSYSVNITGQVISSAPNLKVLIDDQIEIPQIVSGSEFNYEHEYLEAGPNALRISLYSGSTLLDSKIFNLLVSIPGEVGVQVATSGGTVSIPDSNSELYGSSVSIPAGALSSSEFILIQYGDSWGPNLPATYTAVGPTISLNPYLLKFSESVTITIPYSKEQLPIGASQDNLKILVFDGRSWKELEPSAITFNSVSLKANQFDNYAYRVVVETPILDGQLQVLSNVFGATIYIDGLFKGDLAPAMLESITHGSHTLKIYRPGYNEVQQTVSYPLQKKIEFHLTAMESIAPVVQLDPSLVDGMSVSDNLIVISGQIGIDSSVENSGFVVLSQNNRDISQSLSADGKFSFIIPLFKGNNNIQVRATVNGKTGLSQKVKIIQGQSSALLKSFFSDVGQGEGTLAGRLEQDFYSVNIRNKKIEVVNPKNNASRTSLMALAVADDERLDQQIKVILTWDKADTDVDMHVYDDYGGHAWYANLGGIEQASLDRDDIDGFGPEVFTLDRPLPGKYPVRIHYYSDNENGPTTASVQVFLAGQLVFQGVQSLTSNQWWDAYEIDVQGITIHNAYTLEGISSEPTPKECQAYTKYACVNYIFTTLAAESTIMVEVSAPESLLDSQIHYRVKELSRGFTVPVNATGRGISFKAQNMPLISLTNPAASARLLYEIVAYSDTGIESDPYYIVQDTRSQIRQEYIDKRNLLPNFQRETPSYSAINDGLNFPGPNFYTYQEMIQWSDFAQFGFGIVQNSIQYANAVNSAYKGIHPEVTRLELTSGWRNPRRNEQLEKLSSVNSYHQSGDSIDLITHKSVYNTTYAANLTELCEIAYSATSGTDVIKHGNHVHIEPYNGISRVKQCTDKK